MSACTVRWRAALAALALASGGGLAACGDDDEAAQTAPQATATETAPATETPAEESGETLEITASEDGGLSFEPASLTAPAGSVTVTMDSPDANRLPHAVEIEGNGVEQAGETVQPGGTSTVTADLEPGEYVYYCPVGTHREQGMEGTLTVE